MTKSRAALFGILLVAALLRFTGLDWDQGQHLNPDERFLTMVTNALRWPTGVAEYFDEAASPLNPRNAGYRFFAYGTLPLTLVKAVADATGQTGYQGIVYAGRFFSALFDLATVLLVFLLALELRAGRRAALLAAALYALSVCAIQYAHFFVVDSFANCLIAASLLFTARYQMRGNLRSLAAAGAWLGLAMGAKVSALAVAPVVLLVIVSRGRSAAAALRFGLFCLCAIAVFRVAEPAAFHGLKPSARWLADMRLVMQSASGDIDMPPGHQWAGRIKLLFPWLNLVVFGMGVPAGLAAWAGWLVALWRVARRRGGALLIPVAWAGLLFFYHGTSYVMSMRYFLPIYGVLCILAAWLLSRRAPRLAPVVLALTAAWAVWFATAVYLQPHTRVQASDWIYRHVPVGSALSCEYWDDCLPLRLPGHDRGAYPTVEMRWYDEDTPEKLARAREWLDRSDYIVLSSNRLSDSIPRLPARYPMTVLYYRALLDGSLGFAPAARFSAFPSGYAEEAFSVYDHPVVRIYRKTPRYDAARVQALLGPVRWQDVAVVRARDAARAPTGLLLPGGAVAQADPTPWDRLFPARRFPAAFWVGAMFLLGWAAMPLLFAACPALPDRGYGFAKTLGLLLPAWAAWWLGQTGAGFRQPSIWAAAALLAAAGTATAILHRRELREFVMRRWRLLLAVDALFLAAFLLMAAIRSVHTDLWHPYFGGEKPMDLAYLTATARSASFPPFNPWFAGGFINYYYFGFVLVAYLLKGCGIAPEVGFNIALPALYAMAATGLYSLAMALWPGRRRAWGALAAPFLVLAVGNFKQVTLWLAALPRGFAGRPLWTWYFDASRAISAPPGEPGPITEFPFFSFLYGDLHAHLLALPLFVLALGMAASLALSRQASTGSRRASLGLAALACGALWATNTWDLPVALLLIAGGIWLSGGSAKGRIAAAVAVPAAAWLLFLPFHRWFVSPYGWFELWRGSHTASFDYLVTYGVSLLLVAAWLAAEARRPRTAVCLALASALWMALGGGAWVLILLLLCGVASAWRAAGPEPATRFTLLIAATAFGLTLVVEAVVLRGDVGRMNTVFKFGFEAWTLLGLAAALVLPHLAKRFPPRARLVAVPLLLAALVYPVTAPYFRGRDRFDPRRPASWNGMDFMATAVHRQCGGEFPLAPDLEAIGWLRTNVPAGATIAEGTTHPVEYGWGNRMSTYTGLSAIAGWDWHLRQQMGIQDAGRVERRIADVKEIYNTPDAGRAWRLLRQYEAQYVVAGGLEHACFAAAGLAKFEASAGRHWDLAFSAAGVRIYKVRPSIQ